MSDIVERLRKLGGDTVGNYGMPIAHEAADEIESLRQQLATTVRLLAGSQAREQEILHEANEWADAATNGIQWLRNIQEGISTPDAALSNMAECVEHCMEVHRHIKSDSTALDAAIAKAKREERIAALIDAAQKFEHGERVISRERISWFLRNMADELKGGEQ